MRRWRVTLASPALVLAACGGGGGGGTGVSSVGSTAPANTTVTNLVASQSFTNDAGTNHISLDLTTKTTVTATSAKDALSVSYDAGSKSYTLSAGTTTQTFGPGNVATTTANDTQYRITGASGNSYLTVVKQPYTATTTPQ